jgi:hypothetical protein
MDCTLFQVVLWREKMFTLHIQKTAFWLTLLISMVSSTAISAVEDLVPYDDFETGGINSSNWQFSVARRFVENGKLKMRHKMFGRTNADKGRSSGGVFMPFQKPEAITGIEATVVIKGLRNTRCPANAAASLSMFRIFGAYFNTSVVPNTPGDVLDDVLVDLHVEQESGTSQVNDNLAVVASIDRCILKDCDDTESLFYQNLGSALRGEEIKLKVQWDKDNHRFIFQYDDNAPVFANYKESDTSPPGSNYKELRVQNFPVSCASGPATITAMTALVDDVMLNQSAVSK